MPVFLVIVGVMLIVTAFRGTYTQLATQLGTDFTGSPNYVYWIAAIGIIGTLGYIPNFETPSRLLLALIIISFFIGNPSFFTNLENAFSSATPATATPDPTLQGPLTVQITGAGASGILGTLTSAATKAGTSAAAGGITTVANLAGTGGL